MLQKDFIKKQAHLVYNSIFISLKYKSIYIFITILERKDQVKKRTCSLGCSSFFFVFFYRQKKKKRSRLKNRKATVPGCHRFVHIWGREANSRTWILTHLHPHTSTHRSVVSPRFLKPCSPLYPWTRCEKSTVITSWTWSFGVVTSTGGCFFNGVVVALKVQTKPKNKNLLTDKHSTWKIKIYTCMQRRLLFL